MFTGIIEQLAEVVALKKEGSNVHFSLKSSITKELKIDQSVAHNGVCLTVVDIKDDVYTVMAINETLNQANKQDLICIIGTHFWGEALKTKFDISFDNL